MPPRTSCAISSHEATGLSPTSPTSTRPPRWKNAIKVIAVPLNLPVSPTDQSWFVETPARRKIIPQKAFFLSSAHFFNAPTHQRPSLLSTILLPREPTPPCENLASVSPTTSLWPDSMERNVGAPMVAPSPRPISPLRAWAHAPLRCFCVE